MNEIYKIPITKNQLRAIPIDDRNLLLLVSHAVNQLSTLRKVMIFSLNYESDNQLENTLSAGQSQILLRFFFGAMAEAWEMVKRPINQKLIGKDYQKDLGDSGKEVYDRLKKHFSQSNLLHNLRNKIVYHYPEAPELQRAFEDVPEDEDWAWYPSDTINNSFYLASDLVISSGILRLTGETDTQKSFEKIMSVVVPVSNDLIEFFLLLMRAIISRHLGKAMVFPAPGSGMKIENAPDLYSVAIPFFTTRSDDSARSNETAKFPT